MRHVIRNAFVALSLTACSTVYAVTTVPFVFAQGTPAKAAEVNADFQALADAVDAQKLLIDAQQLLIDAQKLRMNAQDMTISKLDGTTPVTAADLVGTYKVIIHYNFMASRVSSLVGTMTLLANGNGTFTYTETGTHDSGSGPVFFTPSSGTTQITWTLTGSLFSTSLGGGPGCQLSMGGRLCVATSEKLGESSLFLLTRIQ
jgi:hypothetical protein